MSFWAFVVAGAWTAVRPCALCFVGLAGQDPPGLAGMPAPTTLVSEDASGALPGPAAVAAPVSDDPPPGLSASSAGSSLAAQNLPRLERAIQLFDGEDYAGALGALEALAPPLGPEAQFYWGYTLLRLHRDSEAYAHIEAALAGRPDDLRAVYLRGVLRQHLGLRGATDDFARVAAALPATPIGEAAKRYLQAPAPSAPAASRGASAWRWVPRLGVAGAFDSNPAYSPGTAFQAGSAGPLGGQQFASRSSGAPALVLWGRAGVAWTPTDTWALAAGLGASERLYFPQTDATQVAPAGGSGGGANPGPAGVGRARASPPRPPLGLRAIGRASPTTPAQRGEPMLGQPMQVTSRAYDFTEVAADLGVSWGSPIAEARATYRPAVSWLGYAPFAQTHDLTARAAWPATGALAGSLRLTGQVLLPLDSTYAYLRGAGGTVEPGLRARSAEATWVGELAYVGEGYDAADVREASQGTFYSYSYLGHGPSASLAWSPAWGLRLAAWGGLRWRAYTGADVDPQVDEGRAQRRRDLRFTVGGRLAYLWQGVGEGFAEAEYLDNASNVVTGAAYDPNVQRWLASVGVTWP